MTTQPLPAWLLDIGREFWPQPSRPDGRPPARGFSRIRRGILALAAGILVITTLGVTWGTLEERADRLREARAESRILARAIEPHLARTINRAGFYLVERRGMLEAAGGLGALSPRAVEDLFRNRSRDDAVLRYVLASNREGSVLAVAGSSPAAIPSVADREFFQHHRSLPGRGPVVSAPFRSRIDGHWRLPVSVRVDRPDGTFEGVLNTAVEIEYLAQYFESLGLPEGGAIALVTPRGDFLARHPRPIRDLDAAHARAVLGAFRGTEGAIETTSPVDGLERIGSYRRLGDFPVYAAVTFARDSYLAPWRRNAVLRALGGVAVLGVTAIFTLLLLRQLHEERLAARNLAKFRRAVDLSGDYIYWIDAAGRLVYMNDAAARRLGLDPRRLSRDLDVRKLSANCSDERWRALRNALLLKGEASYASQHVDRDGTAYPVHVSATHLTIDGQDFAFLICRDLSEQARQESEIRALNSSLEQRVRERTADLDHANTELESFAYSVSHDLRAPLNHLAGYAEALQLTDVSDREECSRLTRKIVERSRYMNDLIDALLQLSRVARTSFDMRPVDVSELARQVDAEHRKLEPGRDVEMRIEPGMRAMGDPVLLRTLLENLLGNAWKYTSKQPHAVIEILREDGEDGERAFVVRDNGAGFDPRYAARLFGAFHRLHSQSDFPGTGIGLATARRIVTRHGGRIWAESTPGAGATFRFTLP